jgi:hypothetical protein
MNVAVCFHLIGATCVGAAGAVARFGHFGDFGG